MNETYQIKEKQTVLEHGQSVFLFFKDLFSEQKLNWRLPSWFTDNISLIKENLLPYEIIKEYLIMHDCGKPYCITEDEYG